MTRNHIVNGACAIVASLACATAALAEQTFAYPPADRTADQQRQDQYECHQWAVEQSHFDPVQQASQPATSATKDSQGRSAAGGAVGGAAKGAAVAAVADEDTGDAARAGAALGLIRQRRAQASEAMEQAQAQKAAQQQQAQAQSKQQAYDRARNTCFKARGYTLSEG